MSLITTTPQLNPTVIDKNPTQVIVSQPVGIDADFFPSGRQIMKQHTALHVENMDFGKVATMEKFLNKFDWTLEDTGEWFKYEITIGNLEELMTEIPKDFIWRDFGDVEFTLRTTLNAYVAGLSVLYYDPSPSDDYWSIMFDVDLTTEYRVMFPGIRFQPTSTSQITWHLPFSNPFRMYPKMSTTTDPELNVYQNYIRNYPMGRIVAFPIVPLTTGMTSITRCPFALRAKMINFEVGGTNYATTTA